MIYQNNETMTTYNTYKFNVKSQEYRITIATGKYNYVNVSKKMHIRSIGRNFETFDEAVKAYKNATIKTELLKIELGLVNIESTFNN